MSSSGSAQEGYIIWIKAPSARRSRGEGGGVLDVFNIPNPRAIEPIRFDEAITDEDEIQRAEELTRQLQQFDEMDERSKLEAISKHIENLDLDDKGEKDDNDDDDEEENDSSEMPTDLNASTPGIPEIISQFLNCSRKENIRLREARKKAKAEGRKLKKKTQVPGVRKIQSAAKKIFAAIKSGRVELSNNNGTCLFLLIINCDMIDFVMSNDGFRTTNTSRYWKTFADKCRTVLLF